MDSYKMEILKLYDAGHGSLEEKKTVGNNLITYKLGSWVLDSKMDVQCFEFVQWLDYCTS